MSEQFLQRVKIDAVFPEHGRKVVPEVMQLEIVHAGIFARAETKWGCQAGNALVTMEPANAAEAIQSREASDIMK